VYDKEYKTAALILFGIALVRVLYK
jgi:hypothetical protein